MTPLIAAIPPGSAGRSWCAVPQFCLSLPLALELS
jgi:hypothetical protein